MIHICMLYECSSYMYMIAVEMLINVYICEQSKARRVNGLRAKQDIRSEIGAFIRGSLPCDMSGENECVSLYKYIYICMYVCMYVSYRKLARLFAGTCLVI
jgi:hypothetical protein